MNRHRIQGTNVVLSSVAFGCAALTSAGGRMEALELLTTAYDNGITHFDTARLYGQGQSEALVGEFLRGKRDRVTVATKVGLYPNRYAERFPSIVAAGRRLKHALRPAAMPAASTISVAPPVRGSFEIDRVQASFQASLRALRSDYVDLVLIHEGTLEDARSPDLLEFFEREIERGSVRAIGLGTAYRNLAGQAEAVPMPYRVLQFELNVSQRQMVPTGSRVPITHGAVAPLGAMLTAMRADAAATKSIAPFGMGVPDAQFLAELLLQQARSRNPDGVVLFGTTSREHLARNLAALERRLPGDQLAAFEALARKLLDSTPNNPPT